MNRILFIAPLPPPVHGSAMVSKYIKDSAKVQSVAQCDWVNLSTSRRMDEIGKGGAMKLLRFVGAYLKTLWLLLTHRYDLCYLAITCHGIGFLKDAPFVWLCKLFGCEVLIHQHNKGMSNCIDRWPYRWLIPYIYKRTRVMLLSWYLYPDIEKAVRREQVVICANGIAAEQQVNCDDSQVNVASPRLNAAEQPVNCDDSLVSVASPRLNVAEQQVNCDESQVNAASPRLNVAEQQVNCDDSLVNVASPRLNAAEQQVNCDGSQVNVASPRLNAAGQQVNCDDSLVSVASPRLNAAEQRLIATVSQVNVAEQRLKDSQSQGDDSPATTLRLTSSSAAINRSEAAPLTAHRSPLTVNLFFLSNLIPSKGVYVLLDACRILKERGHGFVCRFVGGETKEMDRATFEAEVQRRGLEGMVRYEGPKYGEEKEEYWCSSDVFVFPTYYFNECFPLVILEAMQHGLPVVSTDEGAVPDIVVDGENGFICRRKDVEGLAQALERLLLDEALRRRMGAKGYSRYMENFTLERFERRFVECLRRGE